MPATMFVACLVEPWEMDNNVRVHRRGPLSHLRILDLTRYQQGPFATLLLADLGADVIKIEPPGGEPGRGIGRDREGFSAYFEAHNRGKRSLVLDLKVPEAIGVMRRLVPTVDVVVENFRPGVMEALGLGYEDLRALRPDIILASASAFGRRGPLGSAPGYDHVAQALSGVMVEQGGGPGNTPQALIGGFADQAGAVMLALGITAAVIHRQATGEGQHVSSSLLGTMAAMQAMQLTRYLRTGQQIGRQDRRAATYTHYRCADGGYVAIAANTEAMWQRLAGAIGRPELAEDGRFRDAWARERHKDELVAILEEAFLALPRETAVAMLAAADVPHAPVLDYAGIAAHPQFRENGYIQVIEHPSLGPMEVVGPAFEFSASALSSPVGGAELGQHSEAILLDVGYNWDEIARLKETGALG